VGGSGFCSPVSWFGSSPGRRARTLYPSGGLMALTQH